MSIWRHGATRTRDSDTVDWDGMLMTDERERGDWRLTRFEHDLSEMRSDVKALLTTIQSIQVSMPMTYINRADMQERLDGVAAAMLLRVQANDEACKTRDTSSQRQLTETKALITRLIFAIISALITGGLALLIEVLKLLSGERG